LAHPRSCLWLTRSLELVETHLSHGLGILTLPEDIAFEVID
jgi:hypothetical protein